MNAGYRCRGARRFGRVRSFCALSFLCLLLAACGGMREGPTHSLVSGRGGYVVGQPYEIKGVWYYPRVDYHYDKTGVASWYGESYNGRPTANGEVYDMNKLSAAHPTLPLPSVVEVTDLQNGRSLELRVNDRGPFVDGRIIDLSRRAAQLLGFEREGTAPVRVKILKRQSIEVAEAAMRNSGVGTLLAANTLPESADEGPPQAAALEPPPPPQLVAAWPPPRPVAAAPPASPQPRRPAPVSLASLIAASLLPSAEAAPLSANLPTLQRRARAVAARPSRRFFIQAGAFAEAGNAERVRSRIARLGAVEVTPVLVNGTEYFRVRLGPFGSVEEANEMLARILASGYPKAEIITD
jgi:peptidoglycan lytic transglycosylase